MLILASVVVWQVAADDGLIHKVLFSKNKVEDSEIKEKIQAAILAAKLEGTGKLTASNLKTELGKLGITAVGNSFPLKVESREF